MSLDNSPEIIKVIKELVKEFATRDKETKKMILEYYKSKDYLAKYLTAEDVDKDAAVST